MNPLEITFHVELINYIEKTRSVGVAKKIMIFVPHPGMTVGTREILSVERVHWLGSNLFDVHLQHIAQVPRANEKDVYFPYFKDMKLMVENQSHMLDWKWVDEVIG